MSDITAVQRWGLLAAQVTDDVHVSVPVGRAPRSRPGLVVHRRQQMPRTARVAGLPTVHPADAVVTSWSTLGRDVRREPAITAVRNRLVTPGLLRTALMKQVRAPGRAELGRLIDLLDAGCESELEIWGFLDVFDVPGLRHGKRQMWLRTPAGSFRLDIGYEAERTAIELDGRHFHASPAQRERDMRRDAALASIGWLTLRFSHRRLHDDVAGCRRDALSALAARRR